MAQSLELHVTLEDTCKTPSFECIDDASLVQCTLGQGIMHACMKRLYSTYTHQMLSVHSQTTSYCLTSSFTCSGEQREGYAIVYDLTHKGMHCWVSLE